MTQLPSIPSIVAAPLPPSACFVRHSCHSPLGTPPANPRKKVTIQTLKNLYQKGEPITMLTAHDFPSGHVADAAGIEVILVGDSLAMVALGMEDTSEVLMEEMLLHCRSVARAAKTAFTVRNWFCFPLVRLVLGSLSTNRSVPYDRSAIFQWDHMRSLLNRLCNQPSASSKKAGYRASSSRAENRWHQL